MNLDEIKKEFESAELEWRLHEPLRELFAQLEAAQAENERLKTVIDARSGNLTAANLVRQWTENDELRQQLADARENEQLEADRADNNLDCYQRMRQQLADARAELAAEVRTNRVLAGQVLDHNQALIDEVRDEERSKLRCDFTCNYCQEAKEGANGNG